MGRDTLKRNNVLPALLRPAMYVGDKGERTTEEWYADSIVEYLNYRKEYNERSTKY